MAKFTHINPDNVATPVAASLGDLVTLGLLSVIAAALYDIGSEYYGTYTVHY